MTSISKNFLIELAKKEKARRDFFYYCKLMNPDFYKDSRKFLVNMCNALQEFYYNDDEFMLVNLPP